MADNDYNDVKCCQINPNYNECRTSSSSTNTKCEPGTHNLNGICVADSPFDNTDSIAASDTISELILRILKYLLYLAGALGVVALVVGGFMYITSAGNEEQAEKGKKVLINAIIGVVVVILSFAIVTIITNLVTGGSPSAGSESSSGNTRRPGTLNSGEGRGANNPMIIQP
jgi:hypothetical protein